MKKKADKKEPKARDFRAEIGHALNSGNWEVIRDGDPLLVRFYRKKSGQNSNKVAILEDIDRIILSSGLELKKKDGEKRIYRKADERPDPNRAADADINRRDVQFNSHVAPEIAEMVDVFRKATGMKKRVLIEEALKAYIANHLK